MPTVPNNLELMENQTSIMARLIQLGKLQKDVAEILVNIDKRVAFLEELLTANKGEASE